MAKRKHEADIKESLEHIVEPLRILAVPVESLNFDPDNARVHPKRNVEAVKLSLETYGQRIPIIVQKDGMVVRAGNARLQAALELGWKHIAAVVTEDTDSVAQAFGLMDNKSADLAEWDFEKVSAILAALEPEELDLTGFADFEYNPLLTAEWSPPDVGDDDGTKFHEGGGRHMLALTKNQWGAIESAIKSFQSQSIDTEVSIGDSLVGICEGWMEVMKP